MRARAFALLVALSLGPTALRPQSTLPLTPGDRVRLYLTHPVERSLTGTLVALSADTLRVIELGTPVAVPRGDIAIIEVGRRRSAGAGFIRGALIGAAVGGVTLGVAGLASDDGGGMLEMSAGDAALFGLLIGAGGGGAAGGALGAIFPGTRWRTVYDAGRVTPIVAAGPDGIGMGLRIAF